MLSDDVASGWPSKASGTTSSASRTRVDVMGAARRRRRIIISLLAAIALAAVLVIAATATASRDRPWRELAPGLDLGLFSTRDLSPDGDGDVVVLRVDAARWDLTYRTAADHGGQNRNVRAWVEELGLAAAINAGMYQEDRRSHVGFLQIDGRVRNATPNDYLSAAVCGPLRRGDPPFRIYDLDETPLDSLRIRYRTVVQNLRLIKRPGDNRWAARDRGWAEAALGEDSRGRALLVFCQSALSMHDLNEVLLKLPLDLVCAQHLEGNLPAQMHLTSRRHDPHPARGRRAAHPQRARRQAALLKGPYRWNTVTLAAAACASRPSATARGSPSATSSARTPPTNA